MQCEMCGKDTDLFITEIEGSQMKVCEKCSSHGKVIKKVYVEQPRVEQKKAQGIVSKVQVPKSTKETIQIIVPDFAKKVKDAREKLGFKQEDFAKLINEKQNHIRNIETGHSEPDVNLARKLERALKITLIEERTLEREAPIKSNSDDLTIGDMITIKRRVKKE